MRHLQIYRAIEVVVREGSIRKAADILAISPSALNRQILALEGELGVPFFERLPKGVRLSTAGEIYYRHFIEHIAQIKRANETIADLSGMRLGYVQIAATREFERFFLPNHIEDFRADHPGVGFAMVECQADGFADGLVSGDVDLALVAQPVHAHGVETLISIEVPLYAVIRGTGRVHTTPMGPEQLIDHDLRLPLRHEGLRDFFDLHVEKQRLDVRPVLETSQLLAPSTRGQRPSAQICVGSEFTVGWLAQNGADAVPLARFPSIRMALCQLKGRVMPLAAQKMALRLVASLQSHETDVSRGSAR